MKELLYWGVSIVARLHDALMRINDTFESSFSDKELHFLVIGLIGMGMLFAIYPLFKWLAKKKHEMVIAWIYVFTVIVVITFAIEIGQKITNTGNMEFADIMFGIVGFMAMFVIFCLLRAIYHGIRRLIENYKAKKQPSETFQEDEDLYQD